MEKKEAIKYLLETCNASSEKDLKVTNVTITPQDNYVRVALTLNREVRGMLENPETHLFEEAKTKVIFTSTFSLGAILRENENAAFAVSDLMAKPNGLKVILSSAKINILQDMVEANKPYINPWSDSNETSESDHNFIRSHVTDIELSKMGLKALEKIADKLLFGDDED